MSAQRLRLKVLPAAIRATSEQAPYYRLREGEALAERWRFAVNASIRSLRSLPERGALLQSKLASLRNIRRLPVEGFPKHTIFYHFDPEIAGVTIVHVLHGGRDIDTIFAGPPLG